MSKYSTVATLDLSSHQSTTGSNRYRIATYSLATVGALLAAIVVPKSPFGAALIAAILCGWSEADGLCGASHVTAITPLRSVDRTLWLWRKAAAAYTAGGLATAAFVGAILGSMSLLLGIASHPMYVEVSGMVLLVMGLVLAARELDLVRFQLPQLRRQTNRMWAFQFGFVPGAAMWGSHIGLGFASVVKHGGWFVLVGYAMTVGPARGSVLLATYWLGRTLPIWAAPKLSDSDRDACTLGNAVLEYERPYHHIALVGIAIYMAAALVLFLRA
jgi:hypothetical protein